MCTKRTLAALVCMIAIVALAISFSAKSVHAGKVKLAFTQQDKIVAFDPATGLGAQTGVATGDITGATVVNFQWTITAFPNYTYNDRVGITDTDGDQIIFRSTGTGRFVIPALVDPSRQVRQHVHDRPDVPIKKCGLQSIDAANASGHHGIELYRSSIELACQDQNLGT
jgi:hypothetical protein